jgi:hypothetical protein
VGERIQTWWLIALLFDVALKQQLLISGDKDFHDYTAYT